MKKNVLHGVDKDGNKTNQVLIAGLGWYIQSECYYEVIEKIEKLEEILKQNTKEMERLKNNLKN